ncbi:integrin alpha-IIb isoform X2 [Eublepharis macularius]|uniref:Integrin alpha-IIb isoform X2 n=1 Tax=Eublepharis macularius TaxID=481883 RepID=A0AA97K8D9_EUBMA|nr:integrin alpha-IIb isoform X2 [Eublepharis macularius]
MTAGHDCLGLLAPFWLCLVGVLLLSSPIWTFNLHTDNPTVFSGPSRSYFGFALDFYQDNRGSMNVVVGAPRANTSQPGVLEAGAVYLCPWKASGSLCTPIQFDAKGDQTEAMSRIITVKTFKSKQWFGASVSTWKDNILACAPLLHWNAIDGDNEATKTPVGSCFVATRSLQHFVEYSPCRGTQVDLVYRDAQIGDDKRYCEAGFSSAVSESGRLLLGAPGGYFFGGMIFSVNLSAVVTSFPKLPRLLWTVRGEQATADYTEKSSKDGYRGYSVAFGEFNEDSQSPEYVVGVPNKNLTKGVVEILSFQEVLWTLPSEQMASYFGHTVAVADINGDGKDDILVGAPLFMERHSDGKLYEVGRAYLYLQRKTSHAFSVPWQKLTGTDVYGRFGMAIAPLGDMDQDGYSDIAIGAPFAGQDGGGRVYIYRGQSSGLSASPDQILENPFTGPAGFGFAVRGASDIDANGYSDVLVGAFEASKVAVYRARPVVVIKAQVVVPDALNPEEKRCTVSKMKVSCFTFQMCVGVSGKNIPKKMGLEAELQLDRMKQKFWRRVFLEQTSQSSQVFPLELSEKVPQTCRNFTAYLRDEADFKDKLSPIVVSFNFSLGSASGAGELLPVLSGQTVIREQTRIVLECGEDSVCIPDLKLFACMKEGSLFIGEENVVLIQATAVNAGEGAYEAELVVELPSGAYFQTARSNSQKLICSSHKENETRLVACEMGNPMKPNTEIKVDMEVSVSQLEEAGDHINFTVQLKSKNRDNPNSNMEVLQVPVKVAARMELWGNSAPASVLLPLVSGEPKNESKKVEDYGPRVEHIYQLQNDGPSSVSKSELLVNFPNRFRGSFLLYISRVTTEGSISCSPSNETNPLKLEVLEPTAAYNQSGTVQLQRWREKRDVMVEADSATLQGPVVVNCSNQACATIHCQVGALERGQGASVTIHAVLWLQSFQEHPLEQFLIQSQALFSALGMPYSIQPETLPSGTFLTGFFKRTRPPTDDEEELTKDPQAQPVGQEQ